MTCDDRCVKYYIMCVCRKVCCVFCCSVCHIIPPLCATARCVSCSGLQDDLHEFTRLRTRAADYALSLLPGFGAPVPRHRDAVADDGRGETEGGAVAPCGHKKVSILVFLNSGEHQLYVRQCKGWCGCGCVVIVFLVVVCVGVGVGGGASDRSLKPMFRMLTCVKW